MKYSLAIFEEGRITTYYTAGPRHKYGFGDRMRTSFVLADSLAAGAMRKGVKVLARVLVSEVMQGKTVLFGFAKCPPLVPLRLCRLMCGGGYAPP